MSEYIPPLRDFVKVWKDVHGDRSIICIVGAATALRVEDLERAVAWMETLEREHLKLSHDLDRAMANHHADLNRPVPMGGQHSVRSFTESVNTQYEKGKE